MSLAELSELLDVQVSSVHRVTVHIDGRWQVGLPSVRLTLTVRLRPRWKDQHRAQAVPEGVPA